jgi:hypothetical protein
MAREQCLLKICRRSRKQRSQSELIGYQSPELVKSIFEPLRTQLHPGVNLTQCSWRWMAGARNSAVASVLRGAIFGSGLQRDVPTRDGMKLSCGRYGANARRRHWCRDKDVLCHRNATEIGAINWQDFETPCPNSLERCHLRRYRCKPATVAIAPCISRQAVHESWRYP